MNLSDSERELLISEMFTMSLNEEAEKWTNPLTEAVQLPVEVGNDI